MHSKSPAGKPRPLPNPHVERGHDDELSTHVALKKGETTTGCSPTVPLDLGATTTTPTAKHEPLLDLRTHAKAQTRNDTDKALQSGNDQRFPQTSTPKTGNQLEALNRQLTPKQYYHMLQIYMPEHLLLCGQCRQTHEEYTKCTP